MVQSRQATALFSPFPESSDFSLSNKPKLGSNTYRLVTLDVSFHVILTHHLQNKNNNNTHLTGHSVSNKLVEVMLQAQKGFSFLPHPLHHFL